MRRDGEPLDWEPVEVERLSVHHYRCDVLYMFPTHHVRREGEPLDWEPVEVERLSVHHFCDVFAYLCFLIYDHVPRDGEPLDWEPVEVERLSVHHYRCGLISISFPTYHFSFFKVHHF